MPYAGMKPVPMTDLPSQQMYHPQQHDMYAVTMYPAVHGLDLRDNAPFHDMIYQ